MDTIADYTLLEKIDETRHAAVYRCRQEGESGTKIIKLFKSRYPNRSEIARFKHEYELIKNIELEGIVKTYDLIDRNELFALVLEDFDGISLKEILKTKKITIKAFLQIASKLAHTLGSLHKQNIVHKDIKPNNILINLKSGKVKLIDFGISSVITRENEEIYNPDVIEGTLVYMSPEQTGRMNRAVDFRTDFYSLGITLYEMLAGAVPFISDDPLGIIHHHLASNPRSLNELDPAIPKILSDIIHKLMAKTPEERYQNGFGLHSDFRQCLDNLTGTGQIESFEIGRNDISLKFYIPQVLVGREEELELLLSAFELVSQGQKELLLVEGPPGIGKSAIINEIHKTIVTRRGYYISGKYDRNAGTIPYSSIIQAFQGLVRQLLTENQERIDTWKKSLAHALGPNGKIISEVIPDIELILGAQPPVPELGPEETHNRFRIVFRNFISVFATWEHPLVIFLDDLQWADSASMDLLKILATDPDIQYLFTIGAYRDTEVNSSHIVMITLDEIQDNIEFINRIVLEDLSIENVNELVSNFLRCSVEVSRDLSEIIHNKTNGNPFFINQFLKTLYEENMIIIDPHKGWLWDTAKIRQMKVTDNVVELLENKITKLPARSIEIMKTCACIGNRFDLDILSLVYERPIDETLSLLETLIDDGFISFGNDLYKFHHDRIQEAAYSLIPEDEKTRLHFKIGKLLLEKTEETDIHDNIFQMINHLNLGRELIPHEEKMDMVHLNIQAGEKAKKSTAYNSGAEYFETAISLLPKDPWNTNYNLAFFCYKELGECEYLGVNFEKANGIFEYVISKSRTNSDKAELYNLQAIMTSNLGKHPEAVSIILEGLALLGITIPGSPGKLSVAKELLKCKKRLGRKKPEDLLTLPEMKDPEIVLVMDLLMSGIGSAFFSSQYMQAVMTCVMLRIVLKHGNCHYSPFVYISYAYIIRIVGGDETSALSFARMALRVNEQYFDPNIKAKIYCLFGVAFSLWDEHLEKAIEYESKSFKLSLETGDIRYAVYSEQTMLFEKIALGTPLEEVRDICEKYHDFIIRSRDPGALRYNESVIQFVKCLKGETVNCGSLDDENFSEVKLVEKMLHDDIPIILQRHFMHRAMTYFLFEEYEAAYKEIKKSGQYLDASKGSICEVDHYFFHSLIITALVRSAGNKKLLKGVHRNQKRMKQWSLFAEENCLHKFLLVQAELEDLAGNIDQAYSLYSRAIQSAGENRFIHYMAIAQELYARYLLRQEQNNFAALSMHNAVYGFQRWGADAKILFLKEKYSSILPDTAAENPPGTGDTTIGTGTRSGTRRATRTATRSTSTKGTGSILETPMVTTTAASNLLDFSTALKASQAISGEIILGTLLEKILKLVIENAGAEKGFLILETKGVFTIEASDRIGSQEVSVLESIPVQKSEELSESLVRYVARTKEFLLLNDASNDPTFSSDPYIAERKPKSILCIPVINQGNVTGVLYLENNLTENAFQTERLGLLSIIASQAAVSIDNARLYANLEEKVMERTRELKKARDALWGEMKLAAKIQTILLPEDPSIEGYTICGHMISADEVGGDYYDVINGTIADWLVIGDVSGHGVPAGLVMMMVQTAIQTIVRENRDITPARLLSIVNRAISYNVEKLKEDKYMTISVLAVHGDGKIIHSGHHLEFIVYRAGTGSIEFIETDGLWLGLMSDLGRRNEDFEFTLDSGDILLLYTDGITEAKDNSGEMFSQENLAAVVGKSNEKSPKKIKDDILHALNGYKTNDDVTMLIIKKK
ncbi:MAG: AAA family ATPase [bacterium]|nr:AAA family ATPase [bacterium]